MKLFFINNDNNLFNNFSNIFNPQYVVSFSGYSFFPLFSAFSGFGLLTSSVFWWHNHYTFWVLFFFINLCLNATDWWRELILDNISGGHSESINQFRLSMILFILSEVMFFFSFFWAFFHSSFSPNMELGNTWPPLEFNDLAIDGFSIPLLNTCLLLCSGVTLTWFHESLSNSTPNITSYLLTLALGLLFLILQVFEYANSLLSINSTIFGSSFFLLTGFHGFHVTIGVTILSYCFIQVFYNNNYSSDWITSFECASWYWHFVDVVWLFLFLFVYVLFGL